VTVVFVVTAEVLMLNGGETEAPAATVTVDGTVVLESLLESITTAPPVGAGPLSWNEFPLISAPPTTEFLARLTANIASGNTVRVAAFVPPP
jgi:hypothetical protein